MVSRNHFNSNKREKMAKETRYPTVVKRGRNQTSSIPNQEVNRLGWQGGVASQSEAEGKFSPEVYGSILVYGLSWQRGTQQTDEVKEIIWIYTFS